MKEFSKVVCQSVFFERLIIAAVFINAACIGIEVSLDQDSKLKSLFLFVDRAFLLLFCLELALKYNYFRANFFKDPWRVFDFSVVAIALIPASGPLSILRAFRVLRALRVISVVPRLRQVVTGLMTSIPGLGAVGGILVLVFYVAAVVATSMFGEHFGEWFGSIPRSAYSLFQVMTLESWSMGIVRPVMVKFSWAWMFFLPFIVATTFIMLNLMIAVIVNSMQAETSEAAEEHAQQSRSERQILLSEIRKLQGQISLLTKNYEDKLPSGIASPASEVDEVH